jgi:benzoyl-CoA reductase/2-hydroxyglutaryl-CoA dehydratase subunit BcrC/BadD/HgdB
MISKETWVEKAKSARDYRDETLKKVDPPFDPLPDPLPLSSQDLPKKYLTPREYELTQNYDAIELLEMLRSKKVTSEELTRAFLRRAALAQYAVSLASTAQQAQVTSQY